MKRREFLITTLAGLVSAPHLLADDSGRFQYVLLQVGPHWKERERALVKLSFEVQKRCNIPVEGQPAAKALQNASRADSPFFIICGRTKFDPPSPKDAAMLRLVLGGGGVLLFDDNSPEGEDAFYQSAVAFMKEVYPEHGSPITIPNDHAIYQSYYLLKSPRGRRNKTDHMEGWENGGRTCAFFSHNDLLGAMEADQLGVWTHTMEMGGGLRRELCFRLGINLTYYALTLNYKKDRAFPPIIDRRRRL